MRAELTTESRTESKKDITDRKDRSAEWWGTCGLLRTCKRPKGAVSGSATTLQRSADILGVLKFDRLSRSIKHFCEKCETYFKAGTKELVAIRESIRLGSSLGRTLVGILLVFAQMEREATGSRTREVINHIRKSGDYFGKVPYGKRKIPAHDNPRMKNFVAESHHDADKDGVEA